MVTFICYTCDRTLKKNQVERHTCCRPAAFICIDCHKTFNGMEYKAHISCISEKEKHWGEFGKKKGEKKEPQTNGHAVHKQPEEEKLIDQPEAPADSWKWKNEIKRAIRQQQSPIDIEQLRATVNARYSESHEDEPIDADTFLQKLKSIKKIKLQTIVSLE